MGLVSATAGIESARYEYELPRMRDDQVRVPGPAAPLPRKLSVFRFSTKYCDDEAGQYYYGYRYCSPVKGRWLSRDRIGQRFDINLYRYNYNAPIDFIDPNGLCGIQFGSLKIGWGNPNLVFNKESWMDLANGVAATLDGLIPFSDPFADLYQNVNIWSDEYKPLSDYEQDWAFSK